MKKKVFLAVAFIAFMGNRQINRILTKKKSDRLNGEFNVPGQKFLLNIHEINQ